MSLILIILKILIIIIIIIEKGRQFNAGRERLTHSVQIPQDYDTMLYRKKEEKVTMTKRELAASAIKNL